MLYSLSVRSYEKASAGDPHMMASVGDWDKSVPLNTACGYLKDSKDKGTNISKYLTHTVHVYMPLLYEYVYSVEYMYSCT